MGDPSSPSFGAGGNATAHPDSDLLAAFAEQSLTTPEHDQVLAHLAVCFECREVIALAESPLVEPVPDPVRKRGLWEMPLFHWGAVAATTIVVIAAVSLGLREHRNAAPATTAAIQNEQPPTAVSTPENRVVAAPPKPGASEARAFTSPREELADQPATSPQLAGAIPHRALHLQQEARYERPPAVKAKKEAAPSAVGGLVAQDANSRDFMANVHSNSVLKAQTADEKQSPSLAPPSPSKVAQNVTVSSTNEMATAEPGNGPLPNDQQAAGNQVARTTEGKLDSSSAGAMRKAAAPAMAPTRWQVSNGKLQHSTAANTWLTILPEHSFLSVASIQNHVWVAGENGVLYHSADNGSTWTRVTVQSVGAALTGNIISVQFSDSQHGTLQTSTGETWATADAGQSWRRK